MDVFTPAQFLKKYFDESPEDVDISANLKQLKGSADKISEEEKERRREEVQDMSGEELKKAFGLR